MIEPPPLMSTRARLTCEVPRLSSCRMGTSPDAVKRLVDRFDQDRRVFLSGDDREEHSSMAETPPEQESIQRRNTPTGKQTDALVQGRMD